MMMVAVKDGSIKNPKRKVLGPIAALGKLSPFYLTCDERKYTDVSKITFCVIPMATISTAQRVVRRG